MEGLESIINVINNDCEMYCDRILVEADEKIRQIKKEAATDIETLRNEFEKEINEKINSRLLKAKADADLEYKRIMLDSKSKFIDALVEEAYSQICSCEYNEYFKCLSDLIISNAQQGNGVVKMSIRDIQRLPKDFEKSINAMLPKGKCIEISKRGEFNSSGFVIEYPDARINCIFESMLEENIDEIRFAVAEILFS